MSIIKRAILYLIRKKSRSLLLLILVFLMCTGALIGISVQGSAKRASSELQRSLGSSFIVNSILVSTAPDSGQNEASKTGLLTPEMAGNIATTLNIAKSNFERDGVGRFDHLQFVPGVSAESYKYAKSDPEYLKASIFTLEQYEADTWETHIIGNTNTELYDYFRTGALRLKEGRHIVPGDVYKCLISEEIAKMNHLKIGDHLNTKITESMVQNGDQNKILSGPFELEIVGVFVVNGFQPYNEYTSEFDIVNNWIFTDVTTTQMLSDFEFNKQTPPFLLTRAVYFVDNPDILESAMKEANEKWGLGQQ